jgi:hypothetical protein
MPETSTPSNIAHDLAIRDFRLMEDWDDAEASVIIAPTMYNDEAVVEPPAARQLGVAGARATYDWLHSAYADLRRFTRLSPKATGWSSGRRCPAVRPVLS